MWGMLPQLSFFRNKYFIIFAILWILWQIFTDELAELLRQRIPEGGFIMLSLTHPQYIMPFLLIILIIFAYFQSKKKREGGELLTIGKGASLKLKDQKGKSEYLLALNMYFKMNRQASIYNFRMSIGYAPEGRPELFEIIPPRELSSANRIDADSDIEFGKTYYGVLKYTKKDGKRQLAHEGFLIYCLLKYTDSETKGREYEEEKWYGYKFLTRNFTNLSKRREEELKPHVKQAYTKRDAS